MEHDVIGWVCLAGMVGVGVSRKHSVGDPSLRRV